MSKLLMLTALSALFFAACKPVPQKELHLVYWAKLDANEIWLVHYDDAGKKVSQLIAQDLTPFDPAKTGQSGSGDYLIKTTLTLPLLHDPAQQGPVQPYYIFEYVQQKLSSGGQPVYYEQPLASEAFSLGVNHQGAGWTLLRESLFVFDGSSSPSSRFEQVYRGPDGQVYIFQPSTGKKQLLSEAIAQGYIAYQLAEFE